jgi:hypothetical protein
MILKDIILKNILLERGIVINCNKKIIINIKKIEILIFIIQYFIQYDNSKSSKRNY